MNNRRNCLLFSSITLDLSIFQNRLSSKYRFTGALLRWKCAKGSSFLLASSFGTILYEDIPSNRDALSLLLNILDVHSVPRVIRSEVL